jgi:hypothetical protein
MIAISYRREDSLAITGRLYDRLQAEFGQGNVFMDFDSIPYGVDFRDHIKQMIDRSKVLVALIGPDWIGKRKHRGRRIDDPTDFVRLEIAYALERNLPIIPILVNNTHMPGPEELPKDIEALAFRNALNLDVGIDFHHHAQRLVAAINGLLLVPIVPIQEPPPNQVASAQSSPASPEAQFTTPVEPPTPEVVVRPPPLPRKPSPPEGAGQPTAPAPPSRPTAEPIARTPSIVRQKTKAVAARSAAIWQHTRTKASTAMLRVGRFVSSIQTFMAGGFRSLIDYLRRHARTIVVSAGYVVAIVFAIVAVSWTFHSSTFRHWVSVSSSQLAKLPQIFSAKSGPQPTPSPFILPQPRENALSTTSTPPATSTPAPPRGVLTVDSTPQGQRFELIDADGNHSTGTTPTTFDNLPVGNAEVIFKREGFIDHSETILLTSSTQPSIRWDFPDNTRARDSTSPTQQVAPPVPVLNPSSQNGRTWQVGIGDFVKQFVAVNQSQDANATVDFYAPNVDYFGGRGKDHGFILHDVQKYNVDWPARLDSIDGDIHVEEKALNQEYRANYKLNLYAENPKTTEWTKGQVATTLDVRIIDGVPKIVAINQKRLGRPQNGRGQGPRPPKMEPPGPIKPTNLTKVIVKKYGFSALLPSELFPDAQTQLGDGATDRLTSVKGCATVVFSAAHNNVRKVFDDYVNQFRSAPDHRKIDYKDAKDTWFVVSASTKTTGYYVKGVRHGDDVFVMELDYVGAVCRIPASMVAQISRGFNGEVDPAAPPATSGAQSTQAPPTSPAPGPDTTWHDGTEELPIPNLATSVGSAAWINTVKPNLLENLQSTRQFVFSTNLEITPDKLHSPLAGPAEFEAMLKLLKAPLLPIREKDVLGEWRHRSIDASSMGVVVHLFHKCRFTMNHGTLFFERFGGSYVVRRKGKLYRNDANSFVFIGTKTLYVENDRESGPAEASAGMLLKKARDRFLMILDPAPTNYELYEIVK